jgi:hypothetical protein
MQHWVDCIKTNWWLVGKSELLMSVELAERPDGGRKEMAASTLNQYSACGEDAFAARRAFDDGWKQELGWYES